MQNYIRQLIDDIGNSTKNINFLFVKKELSLHDWVPEEAEEKLAQFVSWMHIPA